MKLTAVITEGVDKFAFVITVMNGEFLDYLRGY
jgi:hypothetical protein